MNNQVKELRIFNKMSQEELALKANTTRQTISAIENGRKPSLDVAMSISSVFEKSVNEIFFDHDVIQVLQNQDSA